MPGFDDEYNRIWDEVEAEAETKAPQTDGPIRAVRPKPRGLCDWMRELREGIPPTMVPGSPEHAALMRTRIDADRLRIQPRIIRSSPGDGLDPSPPPAFDALAELHRVLPTLPEHTRNLIAAVRHYERLGIGVIPINQDRYCPVRGWKQRWEAGVNLNTEWPAFCEEWVTGVAGVIGVDTLIRKATRRREELVHLLVIDVDGEEGENSLRELEARFGHLPHTMVVSTPRGMHLWFWTREKSRLRKRTLAPGLELHGAFTNSPIVDKPLPPSRRLMPDGTWFEYTFLLDHPIMEWPE